MNGTVHLQPAPLSTYVAKRICLIKPSALGDVVQTLPILAGLRRRFPKAHLSWVVNAGLAELLRPLPMLDEVIAFERSTTDGLWPTARRFVQLRRQLREREFDLTIDLQGLLRSALLTQATAAPIRVGLASAREGARWFYTQIIPDGPFATNGVDRYWSLLTALGAGGFPREFPIQPTTAEKQISLQRLAGLPRPILGVCPGAKWLTKQWPTDRFAELISAHHRTIGGSAVIFGSPAEKPIASAIRSQTSAPMLDLMGKTTVRELVGLLAQMDVVVGNDTGPMHLAGALGVPTISIFLATDPTRSGVSSPQAHAMQTQIDCRSCYQRQCSHRSCLHDVQAPEVHDLVQQAVEPAGRRTSAAA